MDQGHLDIDARHANADDKYGMLKQEDGAPFVLCERALLKAASHERTKSSKQSPAAAQGKDYYLRHASALQPVRILNCTNFSICLCCINCVLHNAFKFGNDRGIQYTITCQVRTLVASLVIVAW